MARSKVTATHPPYRTLWSYIKKPATCLSSSSGIPIVSAAAHSVPLTEDHVHGLGQVIHSAISRHRRVPLITGPEGGGTQRQV